MEEDNGLHRRLLHIAIHQEAEGMDEAAHSAEEDASPIIPLRGMRHQQLAISGFDRLVLRSKLVTTMRQL